MVQIERGILSAIKTIGGASAFSKAENSTRSSWLAATLLSIPRQARHAEAAINVDAHDANSLQSGTGCADEHRQRLSYYSHG